MSDKRTRIVEEGYDRIADEFADWRDRIVGDPRNRWRNELTSRLADGGRILELGCGDGSLEARALASRFRVTGVDISEEQIARARANVPEAEFIQADLTTLEFDPGTFDAVAAFYVFNHVPRDLLAPVFSRIHSWLVPDGYFLAAFGTGDTEEWAGEWLGTTMFFSSYPPERTRQLLVEAGFELVLDDVGRMKEPMPDGDAQFHWVLARR